MIRLYAHCIPVLLGLLALGAGLPPALGAEGATIKITKQDCRRLTGHLADPGVAYQSGRDVHGKPVVPADLGGAPQITLPATIVIDIEVDLQDRFGFPAQADSFEADAQIGVVEVAPDGSARFNGQPLQDEVQAELTRRCQEILYGRPQAERP